MNKVPSIVAQLRYEEEQGYLHRENIHKNISIIQANNQQHKNTNNGAQYYNNLKELFKYSKNPIFFLDSTYKIKWFNLEIKKNFFLEEQSFDSPCYTVIFKKSNPCHFCPMKKAIESKKTQSIQVDSKVLGSCEIISIPIFDKNGLIGIIQQLNFNDTLLLEHRFCDKDILQTQQSIIENAALGIVILDNKLRHITINPAFSGMTGFEQKDLNIESDKPVYWPSKFSEDIKLEIQRLKQKGHIKMETYFQRKDKSIFPVSIVGSTFIDKHTKKEHIILIIDDITKSKATERELKISQLLLLSLVQNLERKVQDRTKKIQQLLKQKNEFINQLGHDLKNPLGPLINLIPVLLKYETDEKRKHMLNVILRNTNHMKNLIIKTIELARLNSDNVKLNFEQINLSKIVNENLIRNNHLFKENNLEIVNNMPDDVVVIADKLRMEELFDNIISNAIKYSPNGGTILITGSSTETTVTISIKDTGIGMSEYQINHVFDEFYKADPSRHDFKSSGLGTSIIKRIVEKHGGHIKIESDGLGMGTTVTFTIQKTPQKLCEVNNNKNNNTTFKK